jgi:hypothetical protein
MSGTELHEAVGMEICAAFGTGVLKIEADWKGFWRDETSTETVGVQLASNWRVNSHCVSRPERPAVAERDVKGGSD